MEIGPLIWIVVGILFVLAEFIIPGLMIVFLGVSALVVGLLVWLGLPQTNGLPFVIFIALSVGLIFLLRSKFKEWFQGNTVGEDNPDTDDIIGKEAEVVSEFGQNGRGKISLRGANWDAKSEEPLSVGERVVVKGRQGITLIVGKTKP